MTPSASYVCPVCRGALSLVGGQLTCAGCSATYAIVDGIPHLVPADLSGDAALQAGWFDSDVAAEFEIERPRGVPALYAWLLREKFRRSVSGLQLRGASVLTVCGGSGMEAEFLARSGAHVTTIDVSPGAARRARERARRHRFDLDVAVADATRLPFRDESVDIVYVHDGLHHLENPYQGLGEMARVAAVGVSVTEPATAAVTALAVRLGVAEEYEEAGNRVARLDGRRVAAVLEDAGFRVLSRDRYGMFYRHEPGWGMKLFSHPLALPAALAALRSANVLAGRVGNKLVVTAVRTDAKRAAG
jgi:SAM-dependent methyltransferase